MDRCLLVSSASNCTSSPIGAPLLGIERSGPIQIGTLFQATATGLPGDLLVFYGATRLTGPLSVPLVELPVYLDPTKLFFSQVGIADSFGQSTLSYDVPAVPALVGEQFWIQGFGGSSFPLQSTPVVGGVVR